MDMNDSGRLPPAVHDAHAPDRAPVRRTLTPEIADETRAFLALTSVKGVGQKTLFALAQAGRTFADVLDHGPDLEPDRQGVRVRTEPPTSPRQWSAVRNHALAKGDQLAEQLERRHVAILFRDDLRFPTQLLDLEFPPHWIFVQGNIDLLREKSVTIVGTRKPTPDGEFIARYLGACLGDWGVPTVSGLAAGIDQLAHEHSLRAGVPTIAVLGTGILEQYPKGAAPLREQILATGGTIMSEYLPGISYSAENFVQRNRLQAALGEILIPAEWQRRSGTAHTVRFAAGLGRPIACLRLPEWPRDRVILEPGLGHETGEIFTVPAEHPRLDHFVRIALGQKVAMPGEQLSFFSST